MINMGWGCGMQQGDSLKPKLTGQSGIANQISVVMTRDNLLVHLLLKDWFGRYKNFPMSMRILWHNLNRKEKRFWRTTKSILVLLKLEWQLADFHKTSLSKCNLLKYCRPLRRTDSLKIWNNIELLWAVFSYLPSSSKLPCPAWLNLSSHSSSKQQKSSHPTA